MNLIAWVWATSVITVAAVVRVWPEPFFLETGPNAQWVSRTSRLESTLHCEENGANLQMLLRSDTVRGYFGLSFSGRLGFDSDFDETRQELSEERILRAAVSRSLRAIKETKFVPWKTHPRRLKFEPSAINNNEETAILAHLRINQVRCPSTDRLNASAFLTGDESYELSVEHGTAIINSRSTLGVLRALQTFQQLFYANSSQTGVYIPNTPLHMSDKPKWPHRGLLLDIARNMFSPQDVLRTIDAMASTKLNRLHIHAIDSQSWPIEILAFPRLASEGAYHHKQIWSADDLQQVQKYGIARGVSVFLEIDMPGHTASVAHAYPDLITAFDELDWSTFAAEPLSGQFKLGSPAVYDFVDRLFVSSALPALSLIRC